jgi:hypothetical protein
MSDPEQDLVYHLADQIMAVVGGQKMEIAESAMTLAIVAMIQIAGKDYNQRQLMLAGLTQSVQNWLQNEDITEWIEKSIVRKHQMQ